MKSNDVPIRIEMATSEIEGGASVAWADPDRLVGIVAHSDPLGAFEKYLLPNLLTQEIAPAAAAPALPETARRLLAALENTHRRLYRENRSVMKDPQWIQIRCAVIGGHQLHLMGCGQAWAYVIRAQRAHLLEPEQESFVDVEESSLEWPQAALGRDSSMRLKVLTLDLEPMDQVVLLTSESPPAPDLRAVASAFHQTQDLKRGCDGLVNLLGVQGASGAAVAFRLIPVTALTDQKAVSDQGEEVLEELVAEVESMSVALSQDPSDAREELAGHPATAMSDLGPETAEAPGETPGKSQADAEPVTPWKPSYARKGAPHIPVLLWIVFLVLISLVGVATLYKPGWKEVRHRIQEIWKGDEPKADAQVSSLTPAGSDSEMNSGESGAPDVRGTVPAGPEAEHESLPEAKTEVEVAKAQLDAGGESGMSPALPDPEVVSDAESPRLPPGMGLVQFLPRERAKEPFAWVESHEQRKTAPCEFLLRPGWSRVFYEDEAIALWSHQVFIEEGGTTWVRVESPSAEDKAFLHIESFHLEEGEGFVPADGDSVFLDGILLGNTPWEGDVEPGWHSLRVKASEGWQAVEVFSVSEGQTRYFVPRLGLQELATFHHMSPGRALLSGPILLSVEIHAPDGEFVRDPRLHLIPRNRSQMDVPLAPVDPSRGLYVGAVDPEHVRIGELVQYYFSCLSQGGAPAVSEMYGLTPVRDVSDLQDAD
jgi:hypothetical protein